MSTKKYLTFAFVAVFSFLLIFCKPIGAKAADNFTVAAKAAYAVEADSGKIFYDQNGETPAGIASITKILSMYLVLENVRDGKLSWDEQVNISDYAAALSVKPEFSNVPLYTNQTYSVRELYEAALIESANAAVVALAEKIAGNEHAFVDQMKAQLNTWGITDATIVTCSGLSNGDIGEANSYPGFPAEQENMMSAKDVAIVADHLLKDFPEVLETTKTVNKTFAAGTPSETAMTNWNYMLPGYLNYKEGVDGLKTGTTDFAGACFVGTMIKDGVRIITVVLNADNGEADAGARFTQTGSLMDYCYSNWSKQELPIAKEKVPGVKTIHVPEGKEMTVPVALKDNVTFWVRKGMDTANLTITPAFTAGADSAEGIAAPVKNSAKVGTATVQMNDDNLGYLDSSVKTTTDIVTTKSVEKANFFVLIWRKIKNFFSDLFSGMVQPILIRTNY